MEVGPPTEEQMLNVLSASNQPRIVVDPPVDRRSDMNRPSSPHTTDRRATLRSTIRRKLLNVDSRDAGYTPALVFASSPRAGVVHPEPCAADVPAVNGPFIAAHPAATSRATPIELTRDETALLPDTPQHEIEELDKGIKRER